MSTRLSLSDNAIAAILAVIFEHDSELLSHKGQKAAVDYMIQAQKEREITAKQAAELDKLFDKTAKTNT